MTAINYWYDDQTLMQSIGDSEHLINTGSLLSQSRPSLFATDYLPQPKSKQ